jgi:hypothetical protein
MARVRGCHVSVVLPSQSTVETELLTYLLDRGGRCSIQHAYSDLADRLQLSAE